MTKLITISLRWLRRDKKRTLLSFLSVVMAMYMMCFLGIYFSSAVSMLRSYEGYQSGRAHITINCRDFEQAETISHNTAVSEAAYTAEVEGIFYNKYISDYREKCANGEYYFPRLYINGKDELEVYDTTYYGSIISGDLWSLSGSGKKSIKGRFPENENEIAISSGMADLYGLEIGSELKITYDVFKGKVFYSVHKEPIFGDPYGDGDAISVEEGKELSEKYAEDELKEDTEGVLQRSGMWQYVLELREALEKMQGPGYIFDYTDDAYENNIVFKVRGEISDDKVEEYEKTYTVVGRTSGNNEGFIFSSGDSWAKQFFKGEGVDCFTRIKEGLDIDNEAVQLCESAGLIADGVDENGNMVKSFSANNDLIFWEGRDFSRASNVIVLFLLAIIIVAVFVFFARLIVNNAFELSSAYRAEQYGALKTIGTSNRQMFFLIMTECVVYIITALPIALGLALLTGKAIMSKIMDIKIFDIKYGDGVTEKFFSLEIIPMIMVVIIAVAIFSIVMSGYACAIRIRKLSPIEAFKGVRDKAKPRRSRWFIRRRFGFAAGYAARNAFRHKMHGGITMLAAIVSGSLIILIGTLIYGANKADILENGLQSDFDLYISQNEVSAKNSTVAQEYQKIVDTGMFSSVIPSVNRYIFTRDETANDLLLDSVTDEYRAYYKRLTSGLEFAGINVMAVSKEQFESVTTDVSYEDFLASDGVLLCGYDTYSFQTPMKVFKDGLTEVTIPLSSSSDDSIVLPVAGYFDFGSSSTLYHVQEMTAIIPLERAEQFYDPIDEAMGTPGTVEYWFSLDAVEGREYEARSFLSENYTNLQSNIEQSITQKRIAQAIRFAGLSLAIVIFATALINIVSTSAASIVNRRRELSMLRACGMSLRQVTVSLAAESLFYSLLTSIVSALLGRYASGRIFWLISPAGYELSSFSWLSLLIVFGLIFLLMFASYLPTLIGMSRKPISHDMVVKS